MTNMPAAADNPMDRARIGSDAGEPDLNRIRWHCRRGMLELDMVLARFLDDNAGRMTPAQWQEFEQMLAQADQALWQDIRDRSPAPSVVLQWLRASVVS